MRPTTTDSNGQSNGHEVEGETAAVGAGLATATDRGGRLR